VIGKDALDPFVGGIRLKDEEEPRAGRRLHPPPSSVQISDAELAALQPAPRPPLLDPVAPAPPRGGFGTNSPAVEQFLDRLGRLGPEHFRRVAAWVPAPASDPRRDERLDEFNLLVRHLRRFATLQPRISHAILDEIDHRISRAGVEIRPKVARFAWLAAVAIAFSESLPAAERDWVCEPFGGENPY
jgi:hypothetical protein